MTRLATIGGLYIGNRDLALNNYRKAADLGSKEALKYLNKEGINH